MLNDTDLTAFEYLWDGSENWSLFKSEHDLARIIIRLSGEPTPSELLAVRKLLPEYQHLRPEEVKHCLEGKRKLSIGPVGSEAARQLARRASEIGLEVRLEDLSYTRYLPVVRTADGDFCLTIEDNEVARRVCERMLDAGVPVEDMHTNDAV